MTDSKILYRKEKAGVVVQDWRVEVRLRLKIFVDRLSEQWKKQLTLEG